MHMHTNTIINLMSVIKQLPLSLFIRRLSKLNIALPLLKQKVYTIASPRYRNLHIIESKFSKITHIFTTYLQFHLQFQFEDQFLQDRLRIDRAKQENQMWRAIGSNTLHSVPNFLHRRMRFLWKRKTTMPLHRENENENPKREKNGETETNEKR